MMRAVAALGAFGGAAHAQDRAVEVEREPREVERCDRVVRHVAHDRRDRFDHRLRGVRHPACHRAVARHAREPGEP